MKIDMYSLYQPSNENYLMPEIVPNPMASNNLYEKIAYCERQRNLYKKWVDEGNVELEPVYEKWAMLFNAFTFEMTVKNRKWKLI